MKINKIKKAVDDFFECHGDIYVNPKGVEICWLTGNAVCLSAFWPEVQQDENISLVTINTCDNYSEFVECFCIEEDVKSSIDKINLGMLITMYLAGKGAISCAIDGANASSLEFYKNGKSIVAKDEAEGTHEVKVELKIPKDFVDYTKQYFELNKYSAGYATAKKGWPWKLREFENN